MRSTYKVHSLKKLTKGKKIIYDGVSCTKQMVENKDYLYALNVALPDYFEKVQHYLDCAAYDKEYEFPTLYKKENEFKVVAKKCLDAFDEEATTLSPECNQVCQNLNIAKFSPVFESNHTFVVKAVNTFENLAHHAVEILKKKKKDEFNEMAKITKESEQEVKNVGQTERAKEEEKQRLIEEEKERLRKIEEERKRREAERKRKEEAERKRREEEARKKREAAKSKPKKKKPWYKFWRKLRDKKSKKQLKRLVRGKSSKSSLKIAKNFVKKIKANRKKAKKKFRKKKLSRKLIFKHFLKHRKRKWRMLEAAEEPKKIPTPPPAGPPKDPEHEALLKLQKEIYDQIEFMFDKDAPGVVKIADLPMDIESFSKMFVYGMGINIYYYAKTMNPDISKTDLLAILNGTKMGDAMENRIRQVLDTFNDAFKTALGLALDSSFIFNLSSNDTTILEGEFDKKKEHMMPVECFTKGCEDKPAPTAAAAPVEGASGDAAPEGKTAEPKKDDGKTETKKETPAQPKDAKQTRVLEMDRGMDELEGLFDLHTGSKQKQILF